MEFLFVDWLPIVIMLVIFIIVLFYQVGKLLKIPELEAFFSIELSNLFYAFILVLALIGAYNLFFNIANSLLPGEGDIISRAQKYLNIVIYEGIYPMFIDLIKLETFTSLSSNIFFKSGPTPWSWTTKILGGTSLIVMITRTLSVGLSILYASLMAQFLGLTAIKILAPFLFSLGLILFLFPPTRDAGVFLITATFGFYVFFPFLYSLNLLALNEMWKIVEKKEMFKPYTPPASTFLSVLAGTTKFVGMAVALHFIKALSHLSLIALFIPSLTLTLTLAFINGTTKFIMGRI